MKLSDLSDDEWLARLQRRRSSEAAHYLDWWAYYDGSQPLQYVARILKEQKDRFPALTINWPRVIVDGIDERSTVEGFTLEGSDGIDEDLWNCWQANDLDEYQSENHVASLVTGMSYMIIGPPDSGEYPIMTVEDPSTVTVEIDPRTRRVVAALKVWKSDAELFIEDRAALLLPGKIIEFESGKKVDQQAQPWMKTQTTATSPEVPVVPFPNRQRGRTGRSELIELKPVVDAANQTATNMLAAVEHHAVPRKWALGVSRDSFTDNEGNQLSEWEIATGAIWANPYDKENPDAKPQVGQFAASDLRNFVEVMQLLARIASGLYGVPPQMFGFGIGDNPAGVDGIRAAEDRWVRRAERRQISWGAAYERSARIALAIMGRDPGQAIRLESRWRDAATPTRGAKSDAAVKTLQSGISDLRQARLDYGYSLTQIREMERREAGQADQEPITDARSVTDSETETDNDAANTGDEPADDADTGNSR